MVRKWVPVLMAVCLLGTFTAGVATAASSSKGAKACETTKGVLALASSRGKCAAHDKKVTIGAAGPRGLQGVKGNTGAQGPGALLSEAAGTGSGSADYSGKELTIPGTGGVSFDVQCAPNNRGDIQLDATSLQTLIVHGTAQVAAATAGSGIYQLGNAVTDLPSGSSLISVTAPGSDSYFAFDVGDLHSDSSDSVYVSLLVNVGSSETAPSPSFTVNGWLKQTATSCQADAQVTPATAPVS